MIGSNSTKNCLNQNLLKTIDYIKKQPNEALLQIKLFLIKLNKNLF